MKSELVIFLFFVLITISLEQSDIIEEKDKIIEQNNTSNKTTIDTISNYTGDALSIVLDFTPYISNFKSLGEAICRSRFSGWQKFDEFRKNYIINLFISLWEIFKRRKTF